MPPSVVASGSDVDICEVVSSLQKHSNPSVKSYCMHAVPGIKKAAVIFFYTFTAFH